MRCNAGLRGFLDVVIAGLVIGLVVFNVDVESEIRADWFGVCTPPAVPCPATCPVGTTGLVCTVKSTPTYNSTCPGCLGLCNQNLTRYCEGEKPGIVDSTLRIPCQCSVIGCQG